jgi:alpha-glucosidase
MGVKGFKIDFMDRDDQNMVQYYYRIAKTAATHHIMVDFHGAYKPTGLQRTYPNIVNVEGVHGMEQLKWSNPDMPKFDVTIPFIRMIAGPMDSRCNEKWDKTKFPTDFFSANEPGDPLSSIGHVHYVRGPI